MAHERGSAAASLGLVMMLATAFLLLSHSEATQYTAKWDLTFKQANWLQGKKFTAKDQIFFQYVQGHNVVGVNNTEYASCKTGKKPYTTPQVTLTKGPNYFICSVADHCKRGMKLNVTAV